MELKGRIGMVFEKVRELLAEQLEIDPEEIDMDTDILDDLGADSLDVVELVMSLEEEFGVVITDEQAGELRTVRQLVDFVDKLI
jgi:acyl carrier protein